MLKILIESKLLEDRSRFFFLLQVNANKSLFEKPRDISAV